MLVHQRVHQLNRRHQLCPKWHWSGWLFQSWAQRHGSSSLGYGAWRSLHGSYKPLRSSEIIMPSREESLILFFEAPQQLEIHHLVKIYQFDPFPVLRWLLTPWSIDVSWCIIYPPQTQSSSLCVNHFSNWSTTMWSNVVEDRINIPKSSPFLWVV